MNALTQPVVVLLHGAIADGAPLDEQDVLVETATVTRALAALGYRVETLPLTLDLATAAGRLRQLRPLLVFNLVETLAGSGRLIHLAPALLEELGCHFTGARLDSTFLTSNKLAAKRLLAQAGLPTAAWLTTPRAASGAGPWLVKSVWEHASIGLDDSSLVYSEQELAAVFAERRARYGGDWFAETYIDGREFNLTLLAASTGGLEILAPAEILFHDYPPGKPRIVGYSAKWQEDTFEYANTPRRFDFSGTDRVLLARLEELALRCAALFQLRGYARVDFRVDAHGHPWVLEVNTNPCLAPDAGLAAAAARSGLDLTAVIERIVNDALRESDALEPRQTALRQTGSG